MSALTELNARFRDRLSHAAAPQTWPDAMAGVVDAMFDREFADAAIVECNRLASLAPVSQELHVPGWAETWPLLKPACDANNSTASEAPGYLRSLLTNMGYAAAAVDA